MDRKFNLRILRRRMGWTSSDLARRLGVGSTEIEIWENDANAGPADPEILNRIEFLFHQADICSDEVKSAPLIESALEESALGQIEVTRLKEKSPNEPA